MSYLRYITGLGSLDVRKGFISIRPSVFGTNCIGYEIRQKATQLKFIKIENNSVCLHEPLLNPLFAKDLYCFNLECEKRKT